MKKMKLHLCTKIAMILDRWLINNRNSNRRNDSLYILRGRSFTTFTRKGREVVGSANFPFYNTKGIPTWVSTTHWEELLQSVSDFIFSKHYGYRSRGLRGVKRSEKLWEIQNYPLPGWPFTHYWVKSKTICHFSRDFDAFLNGLWFYWNMAGWSTWQWVFLYFS